MPRRRRYIESNSLYEVVFRARRGLPFACLKVIELIIKSALARTQRDCKVLLCHFLWMANHPHILLIAKDAAQLVRFYGELEKRITDSLKRLLDMEYLDLWEGRPSVIRIADMEAAIERVVYLYCNPSKAGLISSIDQYPGYSSWRQFQKTRSALSARITEKVPWIRLPDISRVPRRNLSGRQDDFLARKMRSKASKFHRLTLLPNAWMKCFGIRGSKEIEQVNQNIQQAIYSNEGQYHVERLVQRKSVLGLNGLKQQPIMAAHVPQRKSRKIFVIARDNDLRCAIIEATQRICELCYECYESYLRGCFLVRWPPGTFPPPLPPLANALAVV